jgi:hypothetical protein
MRLSKPVKSQPGKGKRRERLSQVRRKRMLNVL